MSNFGIKTDDTGSYGVMTLGTQEVAHYGGANGDNSGQLAGFRNVLINGDMRIGQRGTTTIAIAGAVTFLVDRFFAYPSGANVTLNQTQGTGAFSHALTVNGNTGCTQIQLTQRIESANIYGVAGTIMTFSGKIYSSVAFTPTWAIDSANSLDTYSGGATNVAFGSFPALSVGWNNVTFSFATNAVCNNGYQLSIFLGPTGLGVQKGITGFQLEAGSIATPFEHRPIGLELALCQRYLPSQSSIGGTAFYPGQCFTGTTGFIPIPFDVKARAIPTGIQVVGAGSYTVNQPNGVGVVVSVAYNTGSISGGGLSFSGATGLASGNATCLGITAGSTLIWTGCEL